MKIAIASGKGGTGKSTIAANLAHLLAEKLGDVALLDCDVEEPNCHIFLKPEIQTSEKVFVDVPEINKEKCIACGKCKDICRYNALALVKNKVLVFPELCHSCGGCWLICPVGAISQGQRELGEIEQGRAGDLTFIHGKSKIGEAMSPPLIKAVKKASDAPLQILDCPPGTSCPVITAVDGADFVILVTEPTPFGLYDLRLAVDVMKKLDKAMGIVINRSCENDHLIEEFAADQNIKILTRLKDDRKIAECYSRGELVVEVLPQYKEAFAPLVSLCGGGQW